MPILATKLYIPPSRPNVVLRLRLIERLNQGLQHKLTLISAPAGFGKTTLLSEWVASLNFEVSVLSSELAIHSQFITQNSKLKTPVAWLSLDEGDNDPTRFLAYLVAALQTIASTIGAGVVGVLQAPQPPPTEAILTALLNDITTIPDHFVLVLDDYHVIDAKPIATALTFLIAHLPPQMHLVIATREDPQLPLARLRARSQLTELRITDLRFTRSEAAEFLNQMMRLNLSTEDIAALEARTEGWIAGLQLAALSMQGQQDTASFIQSFSGSHHFVMDYLLEEVLQQQSESVQTFLLRTSILERLCGSLCAAVLLDASTSAQATLEYLERANLFIIPLDNERRWYRYHYLFAELLRQRLHQSIAAATGDAESRVNELHIRASQWYEDQGLELEAFAHAAAANDIERAERLIEGKGIPLHLRGAVTTILDWLASLPTTVLNARPALWWRYASLLLVNGQTTGVEEKLDAAEAALQDTEADDKTQNLIGRIATARAVLALTRYQVETIIAQSRRALSYLHPNNLFNRANANWTLGVAYFLQGERAAARRAYTEAIALSQASGDSFTTILATIGLGNVQEADNQLYLAAETYQRVLQMAGEQPLQIIYDAHLGLAHVLYEWNDLDGAEQHGRESLELARQYDRVIDRFIVCEVFLARLKLAQGNVADAAALLAQASQSARQQNFVHRIPEVAAAQVLTLLRQGNLAAAAQLAQAYELPISQARVHLAQGDTSTALAVLAPYRQQIEAKGWQDERLKVMVVEAVALHAHGEKDKAVQLLADALELAQPGGFIRLFVDEGMPMAQLLSDAAAHGIMPDYIGKLLAVFEAEEQKSQDTSYRPRASPTQTLIEPLSQRELEILQLIAQGLSNREISEQLFLALDTVKGHNQKIFGKLQVQRRTEAVARARELGLL
jgi:LuxR family transcriptional regulator, maltose regulon positive regulatory protein